LEKKFPDESILSADEKALLYDTFVATIDIGIDKIRAAFNEPVKTDNLQLVKSVCNFLEIFIKPESGFTAVN